MEFAIKISKIIMNSMNCSGTEASCPFLFVIMKFFKRLILEVLMSNLLSLHPSGTCSSECYELRLGCLIMNNVINKHTT